jgi:hypothetical protein
MIKISGTIKKIFPTEKLSGGFEKRLFWLKDNDELYPNVFQLELWKQDVTMIDGYNEGDELICYIDLKGKHWQRDGREGVMNSLKCWNFEKDGKIHKKI